MLHCELQGAKSQAMESLRQVSRGVWFIRGVRRDVGRPGVSSAMANVVTVDRQANTSPGLRLYMQIPLATARSENENSVTVCLLGQCHPIC